MASSSRVLIINFGVLLSSALAILSLALTSGALAPVEDPIQPRLCNGSNVFRAYIQLLKLTAEGSIIF